jgi:hypothetical protein
METKNIKLKGGENKKAGKNTTQTILTTTGAAVIGAIGGAAVMNSSQEAELPIEPYEDELADQPTSNENVDAEKPQPETETTQEGNDTATEGLEDITQPQPTDSNAQDGQTQPQEQGTNSNTTNEEPSTLDNNHEDNGTTPEQIAQEIIGKEEIDPNDIDTPNVFAVEGMTTVFNEMGYEVAAAVIHTPDGTQYLLADSDGDGVFEGVYDSTGNFVTLAEGNLSQSDLETMIDQTGGYLAINGTDRTNMSSTDPTGDIVDTETGQHVNVAQYMAENNQASQEENTDNNEEVEDVDELLAQLLDDDNDDESYSLGADLNYDYDANEQDINDTDEI